MTIFKKMFLWLYFVVCIAFVDHLSAIILCSTHYLPCRILLQKRERGNVMSDPLIIAMALGIITKIE